MPVKTRKHELIQLIYRHLKEHGFHSAAEELQKHSPQGDANASASLLDIYSSWLKSVDSKRKKEPKKKTSTKVQRKTPNKASKKQTTTTLKQTQAEEECSSHAEEMSQSLLPQTPTTSSKSSPIKPVVQSPGKPVRPDPHVHATPGDSSDSTDISHETAKINEENQTGSASIKTPIKTPKKQAVTVTTPPVGKAKKKVDKPAKKEKQSKKSVPVKRKKNGKNATGSKKSKTSTKVKAAGRDDSDSDSSLDIEKWKKLVLNMSETDVAKIDAINALDSSAPQPKKGRARKTPPKPPARTDVLPPQSKRTSSEKVAVLEEVVAQTPVKAKKNRSKNTAPVNSSDAMKPNTDTLEVRPSPSIPSPSKDTLEENINVAVHSEVEVDRKSDKKKKNKKKMDENEDHGNLKETVLEVTDNKKESNKKKVPDKEICNNHENQKEAEGNAEEPIMNMEMNTTESIIPKKKSKKKKKNDEEILEPIPEDEVNSEKIAEEESTIQPKKAKKKKKEKIEKDGSEKTNIEEEMQTVAVEMGQHNGEESSEQIPNEKKKKKKRKHSEENLEPIIEKRNKFEEQKDEENGTNSSECIDKDKTQNPEQTPEVNRKHKKGSSMKNDSVALSPLLPCHETPGPPSEKKKKKKSKIDL